MPRFIVTRSDLQLSLTAGLIAAVLDATFAFFAYVVIAGRYNFESLLQYIASGLLGHDAFVHHGLTGWLIAALGFVLHIGISLTVAAVFSSRFVRSRTRGRVRSRSGSSTAPECGWATLRSSCRPPTPATSRSSAAGTSRSSSIMFCSWACRSRSRLRAVRRA